VFGVSPKISWWTATGVVPDPTLAGLVCVPYVVEVPYSK